MRSLQAWMLVIAAVVGTVTLPAAIACRSTGPEGSGVAWHRFPVSPATRVEPVMAVIYSSDNIGPTTTLSRLGYPDRKIFQLHRDHPQLKIVLTSCPANRYSGERTLNDSPEAAAAWKSLALDPNFDWVDLAGLGYTFSPPGDVKLDHHEFSTRQSGCNLDHRKMGEADYCRGRMTLAREAYRAAGIPDDRVVMMRFPGMEHSPQALEAASEAGFLAVLDGGNDADPGREWWTPLPGGGEILHILNTNVLKLFATAKDLEDGLASDRIGPTEAAASSEFIAALKRGTAMLQKIESTGGLLNLMDQWTETYRDIGGARPRYMLIDALLRELEARYGPRAWYPASRELVLWLDAQRHASLKESRQRDSVEVTVEPPESWARLKLGGLDNASIRVSLPAAGSTRIDDVHIMDGAGEWRSLQPGRWWKLNEEAVILFPLRGPVRLRIRLSPE